MDPQVMPADEWRREVNVKLESLRDTQRLILEALKGSPIDKSNKGLVGTVGSLEEAVEKLEKRMDIVEKAATERADKIERKYDRILYIVVGGAIPMGWGITDIIKQFLTP